MSEQLPLAPGFSQGTKFPEKPNGAATGAAA
jgi:hypothetical protein